MGAARWLILILLAGALVSWLVGVADMNYLGPYQDQSPMFKIYQVFGITNSGDYGDTFTLSWESIGDTIGAFVSALFFNYSVLTHSEFGNLIRWLLLIPFGGGVLVSLALMLWSHVPFIGRGAQ